MKLAQQLHFPVTPRGAGTGLSGGAVPVFGGLVLYFDRMDKIVDYDKKNLTITVQPGVITNRINDYVKGDGLFYAGYPMSYESCTIGGNVAENAGGGKAIKYGVTGRYVMGMEMVTPAGDIMRLGGKRLKDVTGYNLIQLMVGSEGTLGIFTEITLRLIPLPGASIDLMVYFTSIDDAIAMVPEIMTKVNILPTALEFMDRLSLEITSDFLGETIPQRDAGAMLLITIDGADSARIEADYEAIGELCLEGGALDVLVADTPAKSEKIWKVRRNVHEALRHRSPHTCSEDIVVPLASIPEMVRHIRKIEERFGVLIPTFGHAGDGNLHATVLKNSEWSAETWSNRAQEILKALYADCASLGGTISGEHGIGSKRKSYLHLVCDEPSIRMMEAIKSALDPGCILNPGKVVDSLRGSSHPA
jgi:glycolate oxidase